MTRLLITAAALLLCAAAPALSQSGPSPAEVAAARELLEVSKTRENFIRAMELGLKQGGMTNLTPAVRKEMRDFMDEHFRYEDLEPDFIRIYTTHFSAEDMRALAAFYRTPAGMRLVAVTPEMSADIQQVTMARLTTHMPELMQRLMAAMQDEQKQ